jgi:membrane protease YdiL (CAAX protease family)
MQPDMHPDTHPDTPPVNGEATPAPPVAASEPAAGAVVPPAVPVGAVVHAEPVSCRRCGETARPVNNRCPWCGLWVVGPPPRARPVPRADDEDEDEDVEPEDDWHTDAADGPAPRRRKPPPVTNPGLVVGISYVLLIGTLFLLSAMAGFQGVRTQHELFVLMALVEVLGAVLTAVALALTWRAARQPSAAGTRLLTWGLAVPALLALLGVGIAYVSYLRGLVRSFGVQAQGGEFEVTPFVVALVCVQPAVVEEVFFRQMMMGVFRRHLKLHGAVWLTAGLFAFAHLGRMLMMPYFVLCGAVLGYARAYGGLTLAILLHFLHNFAMIAYEAWRK